ncbi:hypothetical protein LQZ18_03805 [Lachnospiraceae bacterium ZAX-1]
MAFDWTKILGSLAGHGGDALGVASAFTDGNTSDGLGFGAGALGTISAGTGFYGAAKEKDWVGMLENGAGAVSGVADMAGGIAGLAGDKKSKKIAGYVSGGANILGGLVGGGANLYTLLRRSQDPNKSAEEIAKDKSMAKAGLVGNVLKLFSGITGVGNAAYEEAGDNDVRKQRWQKAGQASSVLGLLGGLFGSAIGGANGDFKEPEPPAASQVPVP